MDDTFAAAANRAELDHLESRRRCCCGGRRSRSRCSASNLWRDLVSGRPRAEAAAMRTQVEFVAQLAYVARSVSMFRAAERAGTTVVAHATCYIQKPALCSFG